MDIVLLDHIHKQSPDTENLTFFSKYTIAAVTTRDRQKPFDAFAAHETLLGWSRLYEAGRQQAADGGYLPA